MAFVQGTTPGSGTSKSGSSVSLTVGVAVPVGNLVTVYVGVDNDIAGNEVISVTDSQGNVYQEAVEASNNPGGAQTGVSVAIWYAVVATALGVGDIITATCADNNYSKVIQSQQFSFDTTKTLTIANTFQGTGSSTVPKALVSGLPSRHYLLVGYGAGETSADSFGAGVYNGGSLKARTTGGAADTNISGQGAPNIGTTTGIDYQFGLVSAADWVCAAVAFFEGGAALAATPAAAPSISANLTTDIRLAAAPAASASILASLSATVDGILIPPGRELGTLALALAPLTTPLESKPVVVTDEVYLDNVSGLDLIYLVHLVGFFPAD